MSCKIIPFSELWFSAEFAYFSTDALSLQRSRSGTMVANQTSRIINVTFLGAKLGLLWHANLSTAT